VTDCSDREKIRELREWVGESELGEKTRKLIDWE
jgi:hypothetical protein